MKRKQEIKQKKRKMRGINEACELRMKVTKQSHVLTNSIPRAEGTYWEFRFLEKEEKMQITEENRIQIH